MKLLFAFCALASAGSLAGKTMSQQHIQKLEQKEKITYRDLVHENYGCPENSICSEQMGKKMERWENFVKKLANSPGKTEKLEAFRKKHGLPMAFLARKESALALDPVLFASRCELHNPKDRKKTVYKGIQFFRNDPQSQSAMFDPVFVFGPDKNEKLVYQVPYEEAPIMLEGKNLVLAREYDNFFYYLSVSPEGKWKVVRPSEEHLKTALRRFADVDCPAQEKNLNKETHLKTYCKSVWNSKTKQNQTLRLAWSCP